MEHDPRCDHKSIKNEFIRLLGTRSTLEHAPKN